MKDHVLQREIEILADRLVLSAGVTAADTADVSGIMKLNRNPEGFFIEAHVKLRPVDMPSEGVYLCGTAHGPKLISETIAQAQAAAARAATLLCQGLGQAVRHHGQGGHRPLRQMSDLRAVLPVRRAAVQRSRRRSSRSTRPCATDAGCARRSARGRPST